MMRKLLAGLALTATLLISNLASAAEIFLGTATGTLAVNYNNGGPEIPANQSYFRSQNSPGATTGATFNFDPTFLGVAGYGPTHPFQVLPNQFGFDLNLVAPTWNGTSPDGDPIQTYDNGNNLLSGRIAGPQTNWAISGYVNGTGGVGPAAPNSQIINSLFRGNGVNLTFSNVVQNGTVFTVDVEGELVTDGFIHWYTLGVPDTDLSAFGVLDTILFRGSYSYNSATDTTRGIDFYNGSARFFLQTEDEPVIPEPATLGLLSLGLGGFAALRRRRNA